MEVEDNTEAEVILKLDPPVTTNFVQLLILRQTPKDGLAAFELYGGGYAKQASYESDVIELDDIASLGEIRWSGRATPSGVVSVDSLRIAGVDQKDFSSIIHEDSLGFEVLLPSRLDSTQTGALVEVVFTAPVLREVGTEFAGRVFDTTRPHEVRQRVVPGNATDEIEGDRLSVRTALSESLVFSPQISPNPFTPNGDAWDGRDDSDELVPPGLYLYRLVVDVQSGKETNSGVVAVAYWGKTELPSSTPGARVKGASCHQNNSQNNSAT